MFDSHSLKRNLICLGLFCLTFLLSHCDDHENDLRKLKTQLSIEEFKVAILQKKDSTNLITQIVNDTKKYTFTFESGDPIEAPATYFKSVDQISSDWKVNFIFSDDSELSTTMLGELTIEQSDITLNPYSRCPLCAVIRVETPVKGRFKVTVKGKGSNGIDIAKEFDRYSQNHEIPVLGLYENYLNTIELTFMDKNGSTRTSNVIEIQTQALPEHPTMTVVTNNHAQVSPLLYFSSNKSVGFDREGEIRWYYKPYGDFLYIFPKLANGNLVIIGSVNAYNYHASHFFEITPLGQIIKEYTVPYFFHHDLTEMPNGNFLVLSNSQPIQFSDGVSEEETIVEIDRKTGQVVKTWDFNTILDPTRTPLPSTRPDDWLHLNAVAYSSADNSIIVSGRSQSAIIKIDYTTGQIKWILGNPAQWKSSLQPYLLTPVDANGTTISTTGIDFWPSGQHSPRLKPNGNLLVYDNGDYRYFYDGNSGVEYSRLVEYNIDEANRKIKLVREFNYGKTLYTKYTGSVTYDPAVNTTTIGYMFPSTALPAPKIVEVDDSNNILFEANFSADLVNYRALRIDLYQNLDY